MLDSLKAANAHLLEIIRLINASLDEIRAAKKDNLSVYNEQIKSQLAAFVSKKKAIDAALLNLAEQNPEAELGDLLGEKEQEQLKYLRINLNNLYKKNSLYASVVMSLKDFYDDLLSNMLGTDDNYSEHFKK